MSYNIRYSVTIFATTVVKSCLVFLLAMFQMVPAVLIQQGLFFSIRSPVNGSLCILGNPSASINVRSLVDCAAGCVVLQNCSSFNLFNYGTFGTVGCQLFTVGDSVLYAAQLGCRGYQVCICQCTRCY
jgi:hypothetical protein